MYWSKNFLLEKNKELKGILICHVDYIVYGETTKFEALVIKKLKQIFKFGSEDLDAFTYFHIYWHQTTVERRL